MDRLPQGWPAVGKVSHCATALVCFGAIASLATAWARADEAPAAPPSEAQHAFLDDLAPPGIDPANYDLTAFFQPVPTGPTFPGATTPAPRTAPRTAPRPGASDLSDFSTRSSTRTLGGAGSPGSSSSYMIGDFFVSGGQFFIGSDSPNQGTRPQPLAEIPTAGGSNRIKISENESPIPRDRVFFSYNHFHNAIPFYGPPQQAMNIDRYMPGFEKTFWGGLASFELRTPIASTQNSDIVIGAPGPSYSGVFGNMTAVFKFLLLQNEEFALAVGTGVNVPSAPDTRIFIGGAQQYIIRNQATHIMPYVGALWTPGERFFCQSYLQVDVGANGNTIETVDFQGQPQTAVLTDQTFLYADLALGYWMYKNPYSSYLTGVIPTLELHYSTTLNDADIVQFGNQGFGNIYNRIDVLNMTAGTHFLIGTKSFFTFAGVAPLNVGPANRQFNAEIVAQYNRLF